MNHMLRFLAPALLLLALALAGPAAATAQDATPVADDGLILARSLDETGALDDELVVLAPTGDELRRIPVPAPEQVIATPRPATALAQSGDGVIYLVDAATGDARRLDLPADVAGDLLLRASYLRPGGSGRWSLLGDPQQSLAYLVDLESGDVIDLAAIVATEGQRAFIATVHIAPDDARALLWSGSDLWLIPTGDPDAARRLAEDAYAPSFGDDGSRVVFSRSVGDGATEIVIADTDRAEEEVVAVARGNAVAAFAPGDDRLVLYESSRVVLLDLATGQRDEVATLAGEIARFVPHPGADRVLLGVQGRTDSPLEWTLLDLEGRTAEPLDDLRGFELLLDPDPTVRRWLAFADVRPFDVGAAASVVAVDLQTGEVQGPVSLVPEGAADVFYEFPADVSADGRYRLIPIDRQSGGRMDLWLIDAADGALRRLVADASRVTSSFAPDGHRIAVSQVDRNIDGSVETLLTIYDLASGGEAPLGEGFGAVWLQG